MREDHSEPLQETPETGDVPPLPDLAETIELSPRAQRILLYLARRRLRAAKNQPLHALAPSFGSESLSDTTTCTTETTVPAELTSLAAPLEVEFVPTVTPGTLEPDGQENLLADTLVPCISTCLDVQSETIPELENLSTPTETLTSIELTIEDHSVHEKTLPDPAQSVVEARNSPEPEEDSDSTPTLPLLLDDTAPALRSVLPPTNGHTNYPPHDLLPVLRSKEPPVIQHRYPGRVITIQPSYTRVPLRYDPQRRKRIARLQYFSRKHLRHARANERRSRRRLWTTIWTTTSTFFLLFLTLASVVAYIAYNFISTTEGTYASQVLTLRDLLPPDNLKIYDGQGSLIDQLSDNGIHTTVKYSQIAPDLVNATVAIEDQTFWKNSGVDVMGILRAALADLQSGEPLEGGSTITQQLIKKLIVGDSSDAIRKLSELVLAPQVNSHYSKRDIMEMYLNTIYYGHQAYGIDAAATVYFGLEDKKDRSAASQLDLAQSILLAGLPRNASLYDPLTFAQTSDKRFREVLSAMVQQGYITQIQAQDAYQEEQSPHFFKSSPTLQDQAPHFDDYVLTQLEQTFHLKRSQLSRSGFLVYTTLNLPLQQKILPIMQKHIAEIRDDHHVTNAAEVLIDFHTGAILSMLGSINYNDKSIDGQFNAALAYRQPGSSFKPYVYVTAFEQGASPAQAIDDTPTAFNNPGGYPDPYSPNNYDLRFHGPMTLRCALQNSLNVPAVRVLQRVGVNNALQTAKAMGVTSYQGDVGLSMVLGGLDIRLLDHTSAIGVFANGGVREPYYSISKVIQGTTGHMLYQHANTPGTQVITPQLAYMMTSVLGDNTSRLPEFFDCNVLQLYSNSQQDCWAGDRGTVRPAAAKTGTTQNFRDNWTVGYTTDYVMGVWAGNDDNSPMINVTGVQGAAPIWHDAMLLAEEGHPIQDFPNPGGLTRATVTYPDGVTSTDWFLPGTVPAAMPTPGPTPTPDPNPGQGNGPAPYCSTYSFAFPPAGNNVPGEW